MRDGGGRNRGGSTPCFRAAAAGAQGGELLRAQGERPGEGGRVKVGVHHVGGGVESAGRAALACRCVSPCRPSPHLATLATRLRRTRSDTAFRARPRGRV